MLHCGRVFRLFLLRGPLRASHRHHCLAVLRDDKRSRGPFSTHDLHHTAHGPNVQALLDAAFRQQLQGPPCAGAAECALSCDRDRYSARREPHAGLSRERSERTGAAARGRRGRFLAESNAILWYVAGGTPLSPESRIERAEALQWMFFEQHALEPNIGAAYSGWRWSRAAATCRPMRWRLDGARRRGAAGDGNSSQE